MDGWIDGWIDGYVLLFTAMFVIFADTGMCKHVRTSFIASAYPSRCQRCGAKREAGKTVFFSSHILSDVEAICDRVAILVGGQLRECGVLADVVADRESLEAVLVGDVTLPAAARLAAICGVGTHVRP